MVACTGNEFCRFALVETKATAATWARELDRQLGPDEAGDGIVRMHFSGCPASCAQPQIADIGFRGETAHRDDQIVEAVDIGLGGSLGTDAAFVDWVEGAKPVDEVPEAGRPESTVRAELRTARRFHQWGRPPQRRAASEPPRKPDMEISDPRRISNRGGQESSVRGAGGLHRRRPRVQWRGCIAAAPATPSARREGRPKDGKMCTGSRWAGYAPRGLRTRQTGRCGGRSDRGGMKIPAPTGPARGWGGSREPRPAGTLPGADGGGGTPCDRLLEGGDLRRRWTAKRGALEGEPFWAAPRSRWSSAPGVLQPDPGRQPDLPATTFRPSRGSPGRNPC